MKNTDNYQTRSQAFNYVLAACLLILSSCSSKPSPETVSDSAMDTPSESTYELSSKQFESSNMELGKMAMGTFHQVVKANGMFDVPPENRATVSCYFGGTVKEIHLLPGEKVRKGQVLFRLENPEYVQIQQDYLEAKGQLAYLKSDYERQKNLAVDNVTSQKNYLKAEADYTVTRVRFESLSKKLELMNIEVKGLTAEKMQTTIAIMSPIDGYVTEVAISRGAYLNPSDMAVSIVNTDHLHLELKIFEKDLAKVRVGQPIEFQIQDDQSKKYQATVHLVNKTVDMDKRTVNIHGHLMDEKLTSYFTPGMYVEANILTKSDSSWSLPKDALVDIAGRFYVMVLQKSSESSYSFEKKEVITGASDSNQIEVLNFKDFPEGTQFLVKGAFNLITE